MVGQVVVTADYNVVNSYGSMTVVVTEKSSGVFKSQDSVVDPRDEKQIVDEGLTQRVGYAAAAIALHVATGITEKWW